METALSNKAGTLFYVYFGDKIRKKLLKKIRKQGIYFVEFKLVECDNEKTIVGVHGEKLCEKDMPYGGYGIEIERDDPHVFNATDFCNMRYESDDALKAICEERGFDYKEFKKAFKPFRTSKKKIETPYDEMLFIGE